MGCMYRSIRSNSATSGILDFFPDSIESSLWKKWFFCIGKISKKFKNSFKQKGHPRR
jgi:hypothetical protein